MNKIRVDKIEALTLLPSFWSLGSCCESFGLKCPVSPKTCAAQRCRVYKSRNTYRLQLRHGKGSAPLRACSGKAQMMEPWMILPESHPRAGGANGRRSHLTPHTQWGSGPSLPVALSPVCALLRSLGRTNPQQRHGRWCHLLEPLSQVRFLETSAYFGL